MKRKATFVTELILVSLTISMPLFLGSNLVYASGAGYSYKIFAVSSSSNVALNQQVGIRGTICPNPDIGVLEGIGAQVTYTRPDGTSFTDSGLAVTSSNFDYCSGGSEGSDYIDSFTPDVKGVWQINSTAYWQYSNGTQVLLQSNVISIAVGTAGLGFGVTSILLIVAIIIVVGVVALILLRRRRGLPPPPPA